MEQFNPLPPIISGAADWIKDNINFDMRVFEYGSGTSTLFFSKFVKRLISIEYLQKRYDQVEDALNHFKKMTIAQAKITHLLIEPVEEKLSYPYSYESYGTTDQTYYYHSFKTYVNSIKKHKKFDLILINGRSRSSCIREALKKIKKGGHLILNNSLRFEYTDAIQTFLSRYPQIDFTEENDRTSVWTIN